MKTILACNLRYDLPGSIIQEQFHMPYGLGTIMEILQAINVDFSSYDTYAGGSTDSFFAFYQEKQHDVLLFSGITGNGSYKYFDHVFAKIKALNPQSIIILGGPITSVLPELLLQRLPVDVIIIGEGEETIKELVAFDFTLDESVLQNIRGIGFKRGAEICITEKRQPLTSPLENCSCTPFFAHHGFSNLLTHYVSRQKRTNRGWDLTATRGCLSDCRFCKKVFDKPIRLFSPHYIVDVMEKVYKRHGIDRFSFLDENFVTYKKYITTFMDLLEERQLNFQWRINARLDNFPIDCIDRMAHLGLYDVTFGVESASQKILDHYNKKVVFNKYRDVARELSARNLFFGSFIIGAEIETQETIEESIEFIRDIRLKRNKISVGFLTALPGSRLFDDMVDKGLIKDKFNFVWNSNFDFFDLELNMSQMSDAELWAAKDRIIAAGVD